VSVDVTELGTMDATTNDRAEIGGQINRSRIINWSSAVICVALSSLVPYGIDTRSVPPLIVSLLFSGVLLEVIRRSGLRPRLAWNQEELVVVYPMRTLHLKWRDISTIREDGNRMEFHVRGEVISWEFDHPWLASKISQRYAKRAGRNEKKLREAMMSAQAVAGHGSISRHIPRDRSPLLYTLLLPVVPLTLLFGAVVPPR
jgi:hypothetical protein